ncbi:MAG: ATP-dependent RNA helicase RhlE [Alteromonadaceae bacterium]|jgi:ATP-dependent RNA helicase RhlE
MNFSSLGLSAPILDAVADKGYDTPSPIQLQAIPAVLEGKDVMAAAQTGTGKTAGFTLPILEKLSMGNPPKPNHVRALILTPTRELAAQISESVSTYGKNLTLTSTVVFGGVKINPQMMKLRGGIDILVATPGRLMDLYNQGAIKFKDLEVLVLDEADRMLDMGFIRDIKKIIALLPKRRQNLLFSATFSEDIRDLAKGLVNHPIEISVSQRNAAAPSVEQVVYPVDKSKKSGLLTRLTHDNNWKQVLVFSRTKHGANRLAKHLEGKGISAAAIHGNKSQGARTKALADFKAGAVRVLVATDIAARGLDIDQLPQVVNFDLPHVAEDYVHRIGRTGRAGASGHAISLVSADEIKLLVAIERLTQKILDRKITEGFEPVTPLPASPKLRALVTAKPKKSKPAKVDHKDGQRSGENARGHKPTGKNKRHTGQGGEQANRTNNQSDSRNSGNRGPANTGNSGEQRRSGGPSRGRRSDQGSA